MSIQKLSTLLIINRRPITLSFMIILFLITAWLYFPPYLHSFIGDDYVQQWRIREFLDSPAEAYRIFNPFWTNWYYRPLQNLWFLANRLFFDLNPAGYYYLQLTWHLLAIALIFQISRRLQVGLYAALAAAAFFAISGQHQLAVGWISSIGNVLSATCSLAALAAYLAYLQRPNRSFPLLLTLLFYFCALLAHEEGFLLPLILLAVRLLWPTRPPIRRQELLTGLFLLVSMALFATFQFVRPNANLNLDGLFPTVLTQALSPINAGRFLVDVSLRWLPLSDSSGVGAVLNDASERPIIAIPVTILFLALILYGIIKGSLAIRLGLIWMALHLGFVYLVLWNQRPELFDSRHIYSAWAGLSIVVGGILFSLYEHSSNRKRPQPLNPAPLLTLTIGLIVLLIWFQASSTWQVQGALLAHTSLVAKSKNQLLEILPQVTDSTRLFANRFILTAPYFTPTAGVWYDKPGLTGGTLESLKKYEEVSAHFYLFDYDDGSLYNLMPELQQHQRSILLWRDKPEIKYLLYENEVARELGPDQIRFDVVTGPGPDRRLSIEVTAPAQTWASFVYEALVPVGGRLATAIIPQAGNTYRIVAIDQDGIQSVIYNQSWDSGVGVEWQEILLPLDSFTGQTIMLSFDFRGSRENQNPGFWSNPRIVLD